MTEIARFRNRYSRNTAVIEKRPIRPYDGAAMQTGFRLVCTDTDGLVYYVSCYECLGDAKVAADRIGFIVDGKA